jgi:flavin reductase (DIM6/NTAB) family NADH-FMN oxidoreductase RutF
MAGADAHFYKPANGHGLAHDPFNAIVGPRPIGWISTVSADGIANLAPYSFFNGLSYVPPLIGFSSIGWKDSVANVEATGVFCWNLATEALGHQMNLSCAPAPADVDEFDVAGLTKAPGAVVVAPRVLESPVNFECRLSQILRLRGADGTKAQAWLTIGEVVAIHIDRTLIKDGVYDTAAARPILRAGKLGDYFVITPEAGFAMRRPGWPIGQAREP